MLRAYNRVNGVIIGMFDCIYHTFGAIFATKHFMHFVCIECKPSLILQITRKLWPKSVTITDTKCRSVVRPSRSSQHWPHRYVVLSAARTTRRSRHWRLVDTICVRSASINTYWRLGINVLNVMQLITRMTVKTIFIWTTYLKSVLEWVDFWI